MTRQIIVALFVLAAPIVSACTAGASADASSADASSSGGSSAASSSTGSKEGAPRADNEPPPGCSKTVCDTAYEACKGTEPDRCAECNDQCALVDYSVLAQCLETCSDICSQPSYSICDTERDTCRMSERNAVCVDGMDPGNLPTTPTWMEPFAPPAPAHTGQCTEADLGNMAMSCLSSRASTESCSDFARYHSACAACLFTDSNDLTWGPFVMWNDQLWVNSEGCIASVVGDDECAMKLYAKSVCLSACSRANDFEACADFAKKHECQTQVAEAKACEAELAKRADVKVCGDFTLADADDMTSVAAYFCGE